MYKAIQRFKIYLFSPSILTQSLMKVKEESEKAGLKLNIQKTKIVVSGPISSVQFSHSIMSDSLQPHEPQHARPPCPSPTPRVHPITSWQIDGENVETVSDFIFLGSKINADSDCSHEI